MLKQTDSYDKQKMNYCSFEQILGHIISFSSDILMEKL